MQFNNHILVVVNPNKISQVALDKAIRLSHGFGSKITALVRKKHAVPHLLATLDEKLAVAAKFGAEVAVEISDDRDLFRSIVRSIHKNDVGLVVKEAHEPSLKDHVFLPDDWKLLRCSSVPVLLVHADNNWDQGELLLCVDANPRDKEHRALNELILKSGRFIAEAANGRINLASSYPSLMQAAGKSKSQLSQQQEYRQACRQIVADDAISEQQIHVDQGPPELFIPQLAQDLGVKLVILGTVARSGLKSILLGNTSEQILRRLDSDILVLPPQS